MKTVLGLSWICIAMGGCAAIGTGADPVDAGNTIVSGSDAAGPISLADGGGPIPVGEAGGSGFGGTPVLTVTVRDFKFWNRADPTTNPDFENNVFADDHEIVASTLGSDHKPVYKNGAGKTTTTHGKMYFDQWYNDTPGANITRLVPLALSKSAQGTYGYDSALSGVLLFPNGTSKGWFPIDDGTPYATAFGNQNQNHNYSFTTELHTIFAYNGGESFSFSGDDDVFVYINGKIVIDLGGVHAREPLSVQIDSLGLVRGQQYPLDLFNAERHTQESNLSFTTTLVLQPLPQ
ncbi:MAG: fibro-slime domain-containing protein [Myxococcota bacterium]|nr:fibro-slime domain-containing protein [Myxococcota bacterium]